MEYYLSEIVGGGALGNAFVPRVNSLGVITAGPWIDLRPDSSRVEGWAFSVLPARDDGPGRFHLGNDPDDRSAAVLNRLQQELGVTLGALSFREAVGELLTEHARQDGTRWRPLLPEAGRGYRVYLGGVNPFWVPIPRGGVSASDNFNRANENPLSGGGNWATPDANDIKLLSNTVEAVTANAARHFAVYVGVSWATDHRSTIQLSTNPGVAQCGHGPTVRHANSGTRTMYEGYTGDNTSPLSLRNSLAKWVSGAFTQLSSGTLTPGALSDYVMLDVVGSTLNLYRENNVNPPTTLLLGPVTDTAIVSGNAGMIVFSNTVSRTQDNWEGSDNAAAFDAAQFPHLLPTFLDHWRRNEVVSYGNAT